MASNKIIVEFFLEEGCKQELGEVNISWNPINFGIYNDLFIDLIKEAIDEWLSEHTLRTYLHYEVIFKHVVEHDGAGACAGEYFEPIYSETTLI